MLYNDASCRLYLKERINDARSHERQKPHEKIATNMNAICGNTSKSLTVENNKD